YKAYEPPQYQREVVLEALYKMDVLKQFIDQTHTGTYIWQKDNDSLWKGTNTETNHSFEATVDPQTGLLQSVIEYDEDAIKLSESTIMIAEVTVEPVLLEIPEGYTRSDI